MHQRSESEIAGASLIESLANFICRASYDDLPPQAVSSARTRVMDYLGAALWGYHHRLNQPVFQVLSRRGGAESTVIGEGAKLDCADAAFVNSTLCSVTDLADGSRFAGLHPGPVVIPAALAALEASGEALTGKDLLLAIALGYEAMIRVGQAMNPSAVKRGFHLTAICGPFGATAAAGKLMRLGREEMSAALSIAAIQGAGLLAAFKAPEPFVELQVARACEGGILAARLAVAGVKGYPPILEESYLPAFSEEYRPELVTGNLGQGYAIAQTYIKLHGGCRHIHAPIDAVLHLVRRHRLDWRDIEQITIKTYAVAFDSEIEHPQTAEDAKFSAAFGIAVALIRGDAFLDKFSLENLADREIRGLMRRVAVEHDPALDRDYPLKRAAAVEIKLRDGRVLSHSLDVARGEPEYPLSREEIENKFLFLSAGALGEARARQLMSLVNRLETLANAAGLVAGLKA